ncbi:glycine--tRNA ligase subunit beta [Weissella coleopterorum]|uniref:Glycine--tRNA ligase beta subunit n=1 Tax=Weissella coleopterorum TaxID=2714949 RepID=A0A6G8B0N9_9LACO|nr:glycine--tRNA ligase subunit beta [Weissella coleopterorum]QIL50874.1 glycine--tRNA ligase subunit beta [Weissella coleopterorum]
MADFLMEIGLEEVPAHLVTPAINQLVERTAVFFKEHRLEHGLIQPYSTPRRLAVLVHDVAAQAADIEEEMKGPIKRAALDNDGNFTKAAQGFARGKGMTTDEIVFKEFNGQEFVTLSRHEKGQTAQEVLSHFNDVVMAMTFSTTMKWARHTFEYVRPIRWMVALLDTELVNFKVLDIETGKISRGHRFLGQSVEIKHADDYVKSLKGEAVIVDAKERKELIESQIKQLGSENNWNIVIDAELLEEVNNIVEFPTAFFGRFSDEYLQLPDEVLITSMKEHQRFFHVQDQAGQLLPFFVSVRNGNQDHLENVIAGNEKVLVARLEDAKFFYQEDQKHSIDFYNDKLAVVSFHEKLGSVAAHTRRVQVLANMIADRLNLEATKKELLKRASAIYKFDLMTGMVGEFDELQGVMGEIYAQQFGEDVTVAQAIREHYMPISADGTLPASDLGKILASADKLESLVAFFAGDMIPSGSNDPYALRRAASGLVAILTDNQWHLDLKAILTEFVQIIQQQGVKSGLPENISAQLPAQITPVLNFLTDRVMKELQEQQIRRDIIDAVIKNDNPDMVAMLNNAQLLQAASQKPAFRPGMEALTRVARLVVKNPTSVTVDVTLFENEAEKKLAAAMEQFHPQDQDDRLDQLLGLAPLISAYFDQTMVMSDNDAIKKNRLATLMLVQMESVKIANVLELQLK